MLKLSRRKFILRFIAILLFALGISACFLFRSSASTCRSMAPDDPYVEGAEDAEEIYEVCRAAAKSAPEDPDIVYLAATAALETGRREEALNGFINAEKLGSCNALYFMGDFALHIDENTDLAEGYYSDGADCGDERAEWQLYSPEVFQESTDPKLPEALYNSDIAVLNKMRFVNASYVHGFYEELGEQYLGGEFNPCWKATHFKGGELLNDLSAAEKGNASNFVESSLYEYTLPYAFQILFPGQGTEALKERREALRKAGKADVIRLVESYDCKSLTTYKMLKGIKLFAETKKPLYEEVKEVAPDVKSFSDLQDLIRNGPSSPATAP